MSERELQYQEIANPDVRRYVSTATEMIAERQGSGSRVILEGTPLYQGEGWTHDHEFGYNTLLPQLNELLGRRWIDTRHVAMIDDLNVEEMFAGSTNRRLLDYMSVRPASVVFESHLKEAAEEAIQDLSDAGGVGTVAGVLSLNHRDNPIPLRNSQGIPSCELLDSLFQLTKRCDATVIFHPTTFRRQQEGMREMLIEVNSGELPFEIYNLFYRNGNMSQLLHTDRKGVTQNVIG